MLHLERSVFLLCDVQERFRGLIHHFGDVARVSRTLCRAAQLLERPLVVTEQYPKGLQRTVAEVAATFTPGARGVALFEKTRFSMLTPEVEAHLASAAPAAAAPAAGGAPWPAGYEAVLFGIEAHVCIQQTCEDLLARGVRVLLVVDGISSQSPVDREVALEGMRARGAELTTSAALLFGLLRGADHPHFKAVSKLVTEAAAEAAAAGGSRLGLR